MHITLEEGMNVSNRVIEMENVTKAYDDVLFRNVNMLIRRGEHVAIIGDNGTGKTTLLKIILGLTSIDKGSIKTASNLKLVIFHSMNLKGMAMILCYTHFVKSQCIRRPSETYFSSFYVLW